jgi:YfiH family protein
VAGVGLLPVTLPPGVSGGFTTRTGGASATPYAELNLGAHVGDDPAAVRANRHALARALDVQRVCFGTQVHGTDAQLVDGEGSAFDAAEVPPRCDALVTTEPGVALGVLVADCVPVLLADASAGVIAVAHAGRRGLLAGVLQRTLTLMSEVGSSPADVAAVVGPAIGGCCYEVPAELRTAVAADVPDVASRTSWGTPSLDLPRGAEAVLRSAGVPTVHRVAVCTAEDDRFYSYRRAAVTGRFAGVLVRR